MILDRRTADGLRVIPYRCTEADVLATRTRADLELLAREMDRATTRIEREVIAAAIRDVCVRGRS